MLTIRRRYKARTSCSTWETSPSKGVPRSGVASSLRDVRGVERRHRQRDPGHDLVLGTHQIFADAYIGSEHALDLEKYFIVVANQIGSNFFITMSHLLQRNLRSDSSIL